MVIAEESGPEHGVEAVGGSDLVGAVVVETREPFEGMFIGSIEEGGIGEGEEFGLVIFVIEEAKASYSVEAVFLEGVEDRFFEEGDLCGEGLVMQR